MCRSVVFPRHDSKVTLGTSSSKGLDDPYRASSNQHTLSRRASPKGTAFLSTLDPGAYGARALAVCVTAL